MENVLLNYLLLLVLHLDYTVCGFEFIY